MGDYTVFFIYFMSIEQGNGLSEMTDSEYSQALISTWVPVALLRSSEIQELCGEDQSSIVSLQASGGIVVRWTPWNPAYQDKDGNPDSILRIFYTYEQYEQFTKDLLAKIQAWWQKYDAVLTMPRGGVGIGVTLANGLDTELGYVHAQSYGQSETAGEVRFWDMVLPPSLTEKLAKWQALSEDKKKDNPHLQPCVLLADDMADSWETFLQTKGKLEEMGCIVETATIFQKTPSKIIPDYALLPRYPSVWVVQPWEGPFEGATKWHNIGNIQNTPTFLLTQKIAQSITKIVNSLGPSYERLLNITYVVQKDSQWWSEWILASVSRLVWWQVSSAITQKFDTVRSTNVWYIPTSAHISIYVNNGHMTVQLPNIPQMRNI